MSKIFDGAVQQMPILLDELLKSPLKTREQANTLPQKGIYILYENDLPIYVGRSNRMRQRISEHGRNSSDHYSASFAFNLAKKEAERQEVNINKTRKELQGDEKFKKIFDDSKARVARMKIRAVGIDDPIIQHLFEVYVALSMKTTEYNDFDTH
jgi:hypothetical protein